MTKIGIIIMESTSIRLMLTEVDNLGYFKIINELTSPLKLSKDLIYNSEIPQKISNKILLILKKYKTFCAAFNVSEIKVMATVFFNRAKNKELFLNLIKTELNFNVTMLLPKDEIYYNYLAVKNSIYFDSTILIDVSGNSTNIALLDKESITTSFSLPIGSINLSYTYNLQDNITKEDLAKAILCIDKELETIKELKNTKVDTLILVGDIIQSIGRISRIRKKYPLCLSHNYKTSDIDIENIFNLLKSKNLIQRKRIAGLTSDMANIIVGGTTIVNEIISFLNISNITISSRNLKDGIMYEYVFKNYSLSTDILDYSLNGLLNTLNIDKKHANYIYWITQKLFNELKPLHKLRNNYDKVIKTASLLHDSGTTIGYYNHHKHSFYLILNSYINGLSHKELLLSAAISASHRNNSYVFPYLKYACLISKNDLNIIDKIGILLRIAENLNIDRQTYIHDIKVKFDKNLVTIFLYSKENLSLEIEQAEKSIRKFREVYDRNLVFKAIND